MAKDTTVSGGIDRDMLSQIVTATKSGAFVYTSPLAHQPMLAANPPLVEINTSMADPSDSSKFATRATSAAEAFLATPTAAPSNGAPAATASAPSGYQLITGAVLPEPKKRGNVAGSGAPTKYPFATMEVGQSFFSANSEHAKGDAVKALGSTVSAQNRKYAVETGEHKTQKRAKRGEDKKPILDEHGKKIVETVTLPVLKYQRKFTIRPVEAGKQYGNWTAPADGAIVARTV